MKYSTETWNGRVYNKHFIVWLMRVSFTIFLFVFLLFQVLMALPVKSQRISDYTVTLKLEEESLLTVIKRIEAQTIFRFYYRKADVKQITALNIGYRTRTVEHTLYELLKNTDFTFRQIDNNILLEKRDRQTGYLIKGRVMGPEHKPVDMATVQLLRFNERQLVASALADTGGRFNMTVYDKGEYLLKVLSAGADSLEQKITVEGEPQTIELPDIVLSTTSIQLKDVIIKGQHQLINRSPDKLTLNVEGSIHEKGEDALRLFNVIPGVQVTGKDILFRGSESITVYVDNRRILLPGDQLFAYLRAIPSESIKSYELKVVPGAENDAQHGGVIINIVLKSEYKYGLSGNVSAGYWYTKYDNTSSSAFLNYRTGKFNIQGGLNYRRSFAFYEDGITQVFKSTGVFSPQSENYTEHYNSIGYNFAADYKIDPRQTMGIEYNMFTNPGDISNKIGTRIDYLANARTNVIDSAIYTDKTTRFDYTNQMANVFYRNKLDTNGSRLDVGYSYIYYGLHDPAAIESRFLNSSGTEFRNRDSLFTYTAGKSTIHVANVDMEKHLGKSLVLSAGSKYTAAKTDYAMEYREGLTAQSPLNTTLSNRFLYNEHILAFYGTLAQTFKQWSIKTGLRVEQTNYDGRSVTTGQTIGRNRWNLFPSAYINRKLGQDHSFTLSYARRIDRPGFRQLNPFVSYTNLNTIQEGNPNLLPYYSNNIQLEYLLRNKYSFTVGYQNTENGIAANVRNFGDVIISRDENISDNDNVFISLYLPFRLTKWWELSTNATFRYKTLDIRNTTALHRSKYTQNTWARSKFDLPGKYFIEISGFYSSPDFYDIYDSFSVRKLDFVLKKSFLKERLTANIEIQDPFHLYKPSHEISTAEFSRNSIRNRVDWGRYAGIWLTYNFSKGKKQGNKEHIDAAGNEARRRL